MINYYLLTKPGIIMGNLLTVAAGFLLASKGSVDIGLFFATLLGLALIIASACVFNNYIDRQVDQKMERTKGRPLASGTISASKAITFAVVIGILGNIALGYYTNALTLVVADAGFLVYVILYSLWKSRTVYGTAIGSIAGATPPVVGYCAVTNQFDIGACILFAMMVLWQMPHFFSIALLHYKDYEAAKMPVLPIEKGIVRTKVHTVLYIIGFILAATLLTYFNYVGYVYLFVALAISLAWLVVGIMGFSQRYKYHNEQVWARDMFRLSLLTIFCICFIIPFDLLG